MGPARDQEKRSYHSTAHTRRGALCTYGSRTDVGCVREHNEDSLIVAAPLFVVADGMGGHAAGEVASEIATTTIANAAPEHPDAEALGRAVEQANLAIIDAVEQGVGKRGMGTTCTAAMLEGERLVIAQVGDSRAYLLHEGKLQQITRDHSLVAMMVEAGQLTPEEARVHPRRSVITRALGTDPSTVPDLYEIDVVAGDRLLLCSDGLTSMVDDADIAAIMVRTADPQRCASQLVNEAIAAGGHDNVTVIVADVEGAREKQHRKVARKTKLTVALVLVLLAAIVGGTAWGVNAYVHNAAYLIEQDGDVAIYRGLPEPFFFISYSELVEQTDVPVDQLSPGVADRIREGLRVDNVEAAQSLVEEYRSQLDDTADDQSEDSDAAGSGHGASASSSQSGSSGASGSSSSSSSSGSSASASGSAAGSGSSSSSSHGGSSGTNALTPEEVAEGGEGA